jgi:hypothetical protein
MNGFAVGQGQHLKRRQIGPGGVAEREGAADQSHGGKLASPDLHGSLLREQLPAQLGAVVLVERHLAAQGIGATGPEKACGAVEQLQGQRAPVSPPVGVIAITWPSAASSSTASGLA